MFSLENRVLLEATRGGEELLVLVHGQAEAELIACAERVREMVEDLVFGTVDQPWRVTLGAGVAMHRQEAPLEGLLQRADRALYRAKALGRNRVVGTDQTTPGRLETAAEATQAPIRS